MVYLLGPACIESISGPQENQILPSVGHDDLFRALEVELNYADLIRNSLLMQWNMEVQDTSNYFLEMGLQEYIEI